MPLVTIFTRQDVYKVCARAWVVEKGLISERSARHSRF